MSEEDLATQDGAPVAPETSDAAPETAETPTETPEVEAVAEDATPEVDGEGTVEAPEEPDADAQAKKRQSAQERINQVTAKRREAERVAKELQAENERLAERLAKLETTEPKLEDFDYDESRYQAALIAHHSKQVRKDELAENASDAKARLESVSTEAEAAKVETYSLRAAEFAEKAADFHQVVGTSNLPVTDAVQDQILESDMGPEIAYYMAKNPGEGAKIAGLTNPMDAARAIGRLEARLSQPPPKRTTQAPPPLKAVAGSTGAVPDFNPNTAGLDDYASVLKKAGVIQ